MKSIFISSIRIYRMFPQLLLRGVLFPMEGSCRFAPTCSEYSQEAIRELGVTRGLWLTLGRIARCHPWGGSGYDPVPEGKTRQKRKKPL